MTNKTSLIPTEGILTKEGLQPASYNIDSYVTMMESVSHGVKGAAGMGSPTANRMKARAAEGKIPLVAALAGETSGIGWRIISEPVAAAMLNGFDIITDKPEDDKKIKQIFDDMRIWQSVERATVLKRHQGWSVLVMGDDWVRSHGANWITPSNDWFSDYNDPLFGLPEGWRIQLKSPIGVRSVTQELLPDASIFLKAIPALLKDGEFGAVPAYVISEVRRHAGINLAKDFGRVTNTKPDTYIRIINRTADEIQSAIANGNFGFTDEYWQSYYQRFRVDGVSLIDLKKGLPATPDTAGAVSEQVAKLSESLRTTSVIPSLPAINTTTTQLADSALDDFRLIIKAAANVDLAPGITIPHENMADLIAVDIYDGDKKLLQQTADWLTESMGRMENVSDEALQRGINTVQQGLREGRGVDYIANKLADEMEIPFRRARNVARNEIGNQAWNLEEANARIAGMSIYRWRGMLDERERKEHVGREGKAYTPTRPPRDGNPGQPNGCRCFPEWLFSASDVEEAEKEIAARNAG